MHPGLIGLAGAVAVGALFVIAQQRAKRSEAAKKGAATRRANKAKVDAAKVKAE